MAILKCKMCGGTMEYDRAQNLAICPYCDSKSTVFEQDRKLFEQFQAIFAALLNREPQTEAEEGFWIEASKEELVREDGEVIEVTYLTKRRADMCTLYVAKKNVIFVFAKEHESYAARYVNMISKVKYPNQEMERELSGYIPKLVTECRLQDGSSFIVIEKRQGVYPLKMLGTLLDRHVAWVISRLENLCCLLSYNDMVSNGLTVENLFVDPENHQLYLYGGWWFTGYEGAESVGASAEAVPYLNKKSFGKNRNSCRTDLESIRLIATKLLGYTDRESLRGDTLLPKPFIKFLLDKPELTATKDFAKWDKVLKESYGERKFIPLSVTEEEIYSQSSGAETGKNQV